MAIPEYADWLSRTAGSFYEARNPRLKVLDQAIQAYHAGGRTQALKDVVSNAFNSYISDHVARKHDARGLESWKTSIRNKQGALDALKAEFEPVIPVPIPNIPVIKVPPPIRIPFGRDSKIGQKLIAKGRNARSRVVTLASSKNSARILAAWGTSKSDLNKNFSLHINTSLGVFTTLQTAAHNAYTEYTAFVKDAAQETQAKVDLAKSIFEALESGPFPLSVIGKIGTGVCSQITVDDTISQVRGSGPKQYFDQNTPYLDRFINHINSVKDFGHELARVGVPTASFSSEASLTNTLDRAKNNLIQYSNAVFDEVLTQAYGDGPVATENKVNEFLTSMRAHISNEGGDAALNSFAQLVVLEIQKEYKRNLEYIRQNHCITQIGADELQPYIELQLYAEYMDIKVPASAVDLNVEVPEALITRLESPAFGLLLRKTGSGQTERIYADHAKIAWDDHPKHRGAVILFLRWYKKNVNPFKIAVGTISKADTDRAMKEAITAIGGLLQLHTVKVLFGHNTAQWDQVIGKI
jgi:hypothetical protein